MSIASPPTDRRASPGQCRSNGWTPERQLSFLRELARTRSVTDAAVSAGMSREGAYRLRARGESALFALLWDRALEAGAQAPAESHIGAISDGRLARILGYHFLGKTEHPGPLRTAQADRAPANRARTL